MEEKEAGIVTHYFGKISVGIIQLKDSLKIGDKIHIKGVHDDFTQIVESMQIEHSPVEEAKQGDLVGIKMAQKVHPNDRVYKIIEE
ncbi:MAG: hypothetical protein DRP68_06955 [Candidatus Omnitrophota bacterium]|nr:hypothetical protein [Candidatus Omnitrophota bacterium]RKY29697.1 MAG: hypothetical protein DRP68_06955 [Candidatus Omnitrophota bacterium]RKY45715.1 MAG: hypothetical protein DRP81_02990 [Candidatus Omnitrophota bacterium]HDN86299.1 hypothetical protein [Candidatus Omnitrophota bacterium]